MTKAGPALVKLALYHAAEQTRQSDPQLAHLYWRQMVHHGKTHKQAMGAVMSHLAARILVVLREKRPYELRDVEGRPISRAEARRLIRDQYTVPQEIRRQHRRRNPKGRAVSQARGVMRTKRGDATSHDTRGSLGSSTWHRFGHPPTGSLR